MPQRSRRAGWPAAVGLALVAALLPQQAQATDTSGISFYVVDPSGRPVERPYVATFDGNVPDAPVHWSRGSAGGRVDVVVPATDPTIATRLSEGLPVNLLLIVTDQAPGSADLNSLIVAAGVNVDGIVPDLPIDTGGINGSVFTLTNTPAVTDFVKLGLPGPDGEVGGGGGGGGTPSGVDDPLCPGPKAAPPREPYPPIGCYVSDYPPDARNTEIPLSFNYGAGREMYHEADYSSTTMTSSSIAVNVGASGFFEVGGKHHYTDELEETMRFPKVGPQESGFVYLDTVMQRNKRGVCYFVYETGQRRCHVKTWYQPAYPTGAKPGPGPYVHDLFDERRQDCWTRVFGEHEHAVGEASDLSYSLTLGPNENWATSSLAGQFAGLHATTTITGSTSNGKKHIRRWGAIDSPPSKFHYLFVPYGKDPQHYVLNEKGGGNCPEVAAERSWTYATNRDLKLLPVPAPTPAAPTPSPQPTPTYKICPPGTDDVNAGAVIDVVDDPTGEVSGGTPDRNGDGIPDVVHASDPDDECA